MAAISLDPRIVPEQADAPVPAPGDLVVPPLHISCEQCDRCRSGRPAHCRTTPPGASYGILFGGS